MELGEAFLRGAGERTPSQSQPNNLDGQEVEDGMPTLGERGMTLILATSYFSDETNGIRLRTESFHILPNPLSIIRMQTYSSLRSTYGWVGNLRLLVSRPSAGNETYPH